MGYPQNAILNRTDFPCFDRGLYRTIARPLCRVTGPAFLVQIPAHEIVDDYYGEILNREAIHCLGPQLGERNDLSLPDPFPQHCSGPFDGPEVDGSVTQDRLPDLGRTAALSDHPPYP